MKNIAGYIRKIYITMVLAVPLFLVIIINSDDFNESFDFDGFLGFYGLLMVVMLVVGGFFALGMFLILKMTENIRQIYIQKIILNVITVLAMAVFMVALHEYIGSNDHTFEHLAPFIFTFTMAVWYFELESVI